jgi:hypothetical protein
MVCCPDVIVFDASKPVKFPARNSDDFFDPAKAVGKLRAFLFFSDAFLNKCMKFSAEVPKEKVFLIGEGVCRQQKKEIMCRLASP